MPFSASFQFFLIVYLPLGWMVRRFTALLLYFMASKKLSNYLRTFRKRSYLSQDEVAFLLGCKNGSKVSRYERFSREPSLETALRYEAIFGIPTRELFAGIFQKIEKEVFKRAQLLAQKIPAANPDAITARKLLALRAISGPEGEPQNIS